ncbi:hypothetical protein SCLCIDRAFT_1220876 [Scleroderma citrinum Foug A]|uniref:Secreted protein n=1 Tax=Scleroderma citrinum Foug A TaxID=1036808 RepID=A0A0C3D514_9AGAM|nr:hypothetical protein SCLCIDRAFT_1220876 [Scleroderma citrinum Foug A]
MAPTAKKHFVHWMVRAAILILVTQANIASRSMLMGPDQISSYLSSSQDPACLHFNTDAPPLPQRKREQPKRRHWQTTQITRAMVAPDVTQIYKGGSSA